MLASSRYLIAFFIGNISIIHRVWVLLERLNCAMKHGVEALPDQRMPGACLVFVNVEEDSDCYLIAIFKGQANAVETRRFPPPAVAEARLVFGRKRGAWHIRVWPQPFSCVQLGNLALFVFVETEIEHIEIFSDARGGNGFGDHHQT